MQSLIIVSCFILGVLASESPTLDERDAAIWARSPYENDTSVRPFTITWSEDDISDLRRRLINKRKVNPPIEGDVGFTYGFNTEILDSWTSYWANEYNFTERLGYINQFPHAKTNIQGLDIHFIRVKPKVDSTVDCTVVPVLLLHGFPGSILEFYKAIPLLTAGCRNGIALEVVVTSLPGYGYSDPATRPGMGRTEIATIMKNFMKRLGYSQFYIQGGDWGGFIGSAMATLYPEIILGYHTNFAISFNPLSFVTWAAGSLYPSLVVDDELKSRMYPLTSVLLSLISKSGFIHIQATKPDTVGIAMSDSPSAILSYILMLFSLSRDEYLYKKDGGLDDGLFTRDELIDNLMFYWMPNKFATAARLYAETFNMKNMQDDVASKSTPVPTWTLQAKYELIYQSPTLLKFQYPNLIHSTVLEDYGHFLAFEQPEIFAEDVLTAMAAFNKLDRSTNMFKKLEDIEDKINGFNLLDYVKEYINGLEKVKGIADIINSFKKLHDVADDTRSNILEDVKNKIDGLKENIFNAPKYIISKIEDVFSD